MQNAPTADTPEPFVSAPPAGIEPLGPDSLTWRIAGDRRILLVAPRTLLMQVAHPAVGAGVRDHSTFLEDPWKRLDHTHESVLRTIFGGPRVFAEAERLRGFHRDIKGVDDKGRRYHGLNPDPYRWVHLTIFDAMVTCQRWFASRSRPRRSAGCTANGRQLGLILGLRDHQMPADLDEYREYLDEMLANRLEYTQSVQDVLDTTALSGVGSPPFLRLPEWMWTALKPIGGNVAMTATIGTLPPPLRQRFDLEWTSTDRIRLRAYATAVRAAAPAIPHRLRQFPVAYHAKKQASRNRSS